MLTPLACFSDHRERGEGDRAVRARGAARARRGARLGVISPARTPGLSDRDERAENSARKVMNRNARHQVAQNRPLGLAASFIETAFGRSNQQNVFFSEGHSVGSNLKMAHGLFFGKHFY